LTGTLTFPLFLNCLIIFSHLSWAVIAITSNYYLIIDFLIVVGVGGLTVTKILNTAHGHLAMGGKYKYQI